MLELTPIYADSLFFFSFCFEGGISDWIVLISDQCLSIFYLKRFLQIKGRSSLVYTPRAEDVDYLWA